MSITRPHPSIDLPMAQLEGFCRRWSIAELAVFGSALRDDFKPDSDVDFLVTFDPAARRTLFDVIEMREELASLIGRDIDLVERIAIERSHNWLRRREILRTAIPVFSVLNRVLPLPHRPLLASADETARRDMARTAAYLLDAINFSEQIIEFTREMTAKEFAADPKTQYAVLHLFTLLGEAVRKLPVELRENQAEIPWSQIIGMRNIIVHNYTDIDLDVVWDTAVNSLPDFLKAIEQIAAESEHDHPA